MEYILNNSLFNIYLYLLMLIPRYVNFKYFAYLTLCVNYLKIIYNHSAVRILMVKMQHKVFRALRLKGVKRVFKFEKLF